MLVVEPQVEFETDGSFYARVGGRPATDFVNTVAWIGTSEEFDWLADSRRLSDWVSTSGADGARADYRIVRVVRARIDAVLRPLATGGAPHATAVQRLNDLVRRASARRVMDARTWSWTTTTKNSSSLFDFVVLDAAELIVGSDRALLRACPGCGWLFVDRSRTRGRRWCVMSSCGNRAKAKSHYYRHRDAR